MGAPGPAFESAAAAASTAEAGKDAAGEPSPPAEPGQQPPQAAADATAGDDAGSGGPVEGFGAATPSLNDPACKPGTQEFEEAKAFNDSLLEHYRAKKNEIEETGVRHTNTFGGAGADICAVGMPAVSSQQCAQAAVVLLSFWVQSNSQHCILLAATARLAAAPAQKANP